MAAAADVSNDVANGAETVVPAPLQAVAVETPVGNLEVGVLEPRSGQAHFIALFLHGKSPQAPVVYEWAPLAPEMRQRGVAVLCPNLHSCKRTAPASDSYSDEDALAALQELLRWARERHKAAQTVVYGKSWGGARALDLAAAEGPGVLGLVMVAPTYKVPDLETKLLAVAGPCLLLWAQDDDVIPFRYHQVFLAHLKRRTPAGDKRTIFMELQDGGHRVEPFLKEGSSTRDKLLAWADLAQFLIAQTSS
eukprot:TRINITY_DN74873_c0_g1_i1.p1 TRINITY_DN74873_c0_g1~~TRINITY_DN74873_c0_g1_i1.p1  ORF type:complete len:262 (-),score=58.71 TRINITY_DN74873_c0_g1_i1:32-781(-)